MKHNIDTQIYCFKCGAHIGDKRSKNDGYRKTVCPKCKTKNDILAGMRQIKRKVIRIDIITKNIIYGFFTGISIILFLLFSQI